MQDFLLETNAQDASGNIVLGDIGVYLQQEVTGCAFLSIFKSLRNGAFNFFFSMVTRSDLMIHLIPLVFFSL